MGVMLLVMGLQEGGRGGGGVRSLGEVDCHAVHSHRCNVIEAAAKDSHHFAATHQQSRRVGRHYRQRVCRRAGGGSNDRIGC